MAAYLLVHGAWHDERCWELVAPHLVAAGHDVHTLTLPGHWHKARPSFQISLKSYTQAVCDAAVQIAEPVILVGHSMGGMVISGAAQAQPHLFKHLVYLTGYVPPLNQLVHMRGLVAEDQDTKLWRGVWTDWLRFRVHLVSAHTRELFYHDCPPAVAELAQSRLCSQAGRPLMGPLWTTAGGLGSVTKTYIECLQDRVISIGHQRKMQSHAEFSRVLTLDSSHSPFLSQPEETAAYLFEIGRTEPEQNSNATEDLAQSAEPARLDQVTCERKTRTL
ncbi:MAG: alpha/beta hydrolase [Parvibaculum sp.]